MTKSELLEKYFQPSEKKLVEGCIGLMQSDTINSTNWVMGRMWLESLNLYPTFIQMLKEYYKGCGVESCQKGCENETSLDELVINELFLHYAFANEVSVFRTSIEFPSIEWKNSIAFKMLKLPLFPIKLKYDIHTPIENIGEANMIDYPISLGLYGWRTRLLSPPQDNIEELTVSNTMIDIEFSELLTHLWEYVNIKMLKFEMVQDCYMTREGEEVWEDITSSIYFGTFFAHFKQLKKLVLNVDVMFDYNTFALPPNIEHLKIKYGYLPRYGEVHPFDNACFDLSGYPHLQTVEIIPTTPAIIANMGKYGFKWNMWNNRYEKME